MVIIRRQRVNTGCSKNACCVAVPWVGRTLRTAVTAQFSLHGSSSCGSHIASVWSFCAPMHMWRRCIMTLHAWWVWAFIWPHVLYIPPTISWIKHIFVIKTLTEIWGYFLAHDLNLEKRNRKSCLADSVKFWTNLLESSTVATVPFSWCAMEVLCLL